MIHNRDAESFGQHASEAATSSAEQVEDQDYECDYEQDVDESAGNVEAESEKPQN